MGKIIVKLFISREPSSTLVNIAMKGSRATIPINYTNLGNTKLYREPVVADLLPIIMSWFVAENKIPGLAINHYLSQFSFDGWLSSSFYHLIDIEIK